MRHILLMAIMLLGVTAANAQTNNQAASPAPGRAGSMGQTAAGNQTTTTTEDAFTARNSGSDPLNVPTSTLPTGSTGGSASAGSRSETTTGSAGEAGATGISASPANTSQVPLQLPGERPANSTEAATSTAAIASHSSGSICPPPVPTTDGGSAHIAEIAGLSLGGC